MIRRSVRKAFHGAYWIPPPDPLPQPCILVPNHHGWHDGYLMYHAVTALGIPSLLWMEEYAAFPLFARVGALPFPPRDSAARAATVRRTLRALRENRRSLVLFAEGRLHLPPSVLPFGRSLDFLASQLEEIPVVPVAIRYEHSLHERPEAFVMFGDPLRADRRLSQSARLEVSHLLDRLTAAVRLEREDFALLAAGTCDVNERWRFGR
ncbi:MAG TPA: lysophospholipid acyltransferase family protein [Fimbriimonas sp.]